MMQRMQWDEALSLGHPEIDGQHRRMIEIFNELHAAVYAGGAGIKEDLLLDELLRVSADNFRTEEALMTAQPAHQEFFDVHREVHQTLLAELQSLRDNLFQDGDHVNAKTVNFIKRWLFEHIAHSDRELAELTGCAKATAGCCGKCG